MYPRPFDCGRPNSYSHLPQNIPGGFHYPHGYSQPRFANYGAPIQTQVPSRLRCPPPPLTHLSEQQNDRYCSQAEQRPSCMLQEHWGSDWSCLRTESEEYSEENDGDSLEDGAEGNKIAAIELGLTQIISEFLSRHLIMKRQQWHNIVS